VIIDMAGAEKLLGRGDMLFMAPDSSKLVRLQGCYVSDKELSALVRYWKGMRLVEEPAGSGEAVQQPMWDEVEAGVGSVAGATISCQRPLPLFRRTSAPRFRCCSGGCESAIRGRRD